MVTTLRFRFVTNVHPVGHVDNEKAVCGDGPCTGISVLSSQFCCETKIVLNTSLKTNQPSKQTKRPGVLACLAPLDSGSVAAFWEAGVNSLKLKGDMSGVSENSFSSHEVASQRTL